MPRNPDFRSPVNRHQLDSLYTNSDSDIWDLALWDNEALVPLRGWADETSEDFNRLNVEQQLLVLVGNADGEIGNGGIGQLFFNRAQSVPDMQVAFERMGCTHAAALFDRELTRLAMRGFLNDLLEARKKFAVISDPAKKKEAWEAFGSFTESYFATPEGETWDPASEEYWDRRDETMACIRKYIGQNEDKYFRVAE